MRHSTTKLILTTLLSSRWVRGTIGGAGTAAAIGVVVGGVVGGLERGSPFGGALFLGILGAIVGSVIGAMSGFLMSLIAALGDVRADHWLTAIVVGLLVGGVITAFDAARLPPELSVDWWVSAWSASVAIAAAKIAS